MNILLSAYACRPNRGSELGVGWRWASELALSGNDVWVLTRTIFRPFIEEELRERPVERLRMIYYDPPAWISPNGAGIYLHYYAWQIGVLPIARALCRSVRFHFVQHITLGVFRQPSFLPFLPVPFVFGPVGGGESAPAALRREFPLRGRIIDHLRDATNWLANFDPFLRLLYQRAAVILCKTEDTKNLIPRKYRYKAIVQREIGIGETHNTPSARVGATTDAFKVLYVGRLIYWKGLHLGLSAFAKLKLHRPDAELTVVGSGPDADWLKARARTLGLDTCIHWLDRVEHAELLRRYTEFDVFLFPSLHDSSGNVVLEAMRGGLPVICLDLGGPPTMVDETCGRVVAARHSTRDQVIDGLYDALARFARDPEYLDRCADGAMRKAESMSWHNTILDACDKIRQWLPNGHADQK